MSLYPLSRPPPHRRHALALLAFVILAGCTASFDWLSGGRPAPPPAPTTWQSDTEAGARAYEEGNLEEAENRLEEARERAASGADDELAVAVSLTNLSVVRRARGDTDGAIALQQEAVTIRERVQGPDAPDVATALNSLAGLHVARDDYDGAEPLLVRALAIREQALGASDRLTAQSVNNLALLYAAQGRSTDAEPLYQRAVAVFEQREARDDLAVALENYAALLDDIGRRTEATQMEDRARTVRQETP
jgi:tetratricopeptide (TPR) repeat protein